MHSDTSAGTDYVVTELLSRTRKEARDLRTRRNQIVHSTALFTDLLKDLPDLTSLAHEALVRGILFVLDLPESTVEAIMRPPLTLPMGPVLTVDVLLQGVCVSDVRRLPAHPRIVLKVIEAMRPNRERADTGPSDVMAAQATVRLENYEGDWTPIGAVFQVPRDPEDTGPIPELLLTRG